MHVIRSLAARAFRQSRDDMLRFLYLARGGTKYESAEIGLKYMSDAKAAAAVARESLDALARAWDVQL